MGQSLQKKKKEVDETPKATSFADRDPMDVRILLVGDQKVGT